LDYLMKLLTYEFDLLSRKDAGKMLDERYARFRKFGT